ncbi:hypothetical protein HK101_002882, partial [Irineochytrium annulatum]
MAPNGQNGIKGQYRFVDGVWKYTRVLDEDDRARRASAMRPVILLDESTPLIGDILSPRRQSVASTIASNSTLYSPRASNCRDIERCDCRSSRADRCTDSNETLASETPEFPREVENSNTSEAFISRNVEAVRGLLGRVIGRLIDRGERIETIAARA